ncbi:cation transporter, partial [Escherichia coli]|uniref:cation transporter n=1 Tax=Escherichia coli TaxID=562 RepID=UPI000B31975B
AEALVKKKLMLEGLDCANCAMKIEKGVGNIEGVNSCSVNFATKTMVLETEQNKENEVVTEAKQLVTKLEPHIKVQEEKSTKVAKEVFILEGLDCANCAMKIENKVKEKDLERKIQSLDKEFESKKKKLLDLSEQLPQEIKINAKGKEKKTEVVKKGLFKTETITKNTGNWIIGTNELKRVQKMVNAAYMVKRDYERLQSTDLVEENKKLHLQVEGLSNNLKASHQINAELRERNKELHTKIGSLQAHINDLKINVKVLYQQTKKVFKEQFKTFRGLVKNELVGREVEDYFEREHKNEMTKQRGYDMER